VTSMRLKLMAAEPVPVPAQAGIGWTASPTTLLPADAGPEKLSPFLNVADQVPISEFTLPPDECSLSVICRVPCPEAPSIIEPDQLPTAGRTDAVVTIGAVGVPLPPHAATLGVSMTTRASRRLMLLSPLRAVRRMQSIANETEERALRRGPRSRHTARSVLIRHVTARRICRRLI
jgi:hypothetical protein